MTQRPATRIDAVPAGARAELEVAAGVDAEPKVAPRHLWQVEREAAITTLFDRHHAQMLRLAILLGAGADAEDVVAEAYCELHRRWRKLRSTDAALGYLRTVVCNQTRMRLRHLQVVRRHHEPPRPDAVSAESEVVLREDQREVLAALAELPDRQRQALVLRYWLDLREADVAAAMGIAPGTVKAHTARGMAALNRRLEHRQ